MDIQVGYKLFVKRKNDLQESQKAEILGVRKTGRGTEYYVHYIDLNRRLDEWVSEDMLELEDPTRIEIPKKKKKIEESREKEDIKIKSKDEEYKIKNIKTIFFREFLVEPWYFSPYPKHIAEAETVYICEYCLYYFGCVENFKDHARKCKLRHPPGKEIYRHAGLAFFELDGYVEKKYCRNLALLSKLFLDHKSLYYDIDVFLFYVLCRVDSNGYSVVGYFSKEKISEQGYNLACILTLPFEQRKGYGRVLMDFSYMLSKKDNLISGPEKPLSDLGLLSYRAYWLEVIVDYLMRFPTASVEDISKATHISNEDIVGTVNHYGILKLYKGGFVFALSSDQKKKAEKVRENKLDEKYLRYG
ncbi:Histone acetyltransferase ESA1 [Nosema granulosis]|uniref:Histone acetyltransferase ESA1 n=1 Tax=Nosema granulosis TaxID=83296 RepID=A0A9P6KZ86_9MICR|nr:Histone acetyltransferase ESA1 [Nosema granulosis]